MLKILQQRETTGRAPKLRTLTYEQQIDKMVENMKTQALAKSGALTNPRNKFTVYKV